MKVRLFAPVLAGLLLTVVPARASSDEAVVAVGFTNSPATDGWSATGETSLFSWDSASQSLSVTWDATQTNSFFYHPLGTVLHRSNDFSFSFDLVLNDIDADFFEIAVGLMNQSDLTNTDLLRGTSYNSFNFFEIDYFMTSYYGNNVQPTFSASNTCYPSSYHDTSLQYNYGFSVTLPTGTPIHFNVNYTASNSTAVTTMAIEGEDVQTNICALDSTFSDYVVDTFAVKNYLNTDSWSYLTAHGVISNVVVSIKPVQSMTGSFAGGSSKAGFLSLTNWNYTLLRTSDFKSWDVCSPTNSGTGGTLSLTDTNATLPDYGFYRVQGKPAN